MSITGDDLQAVVQGWPALPHSVRQSIRRIVEAFMPGREGGDTDDAAEGGPLR